MHSFKLKRKRDCGCGCAGSRSCDTSSKRDAAPPPSSRRPRAKISYRFATALALVRGARLSSEAAERLVNDWSRYVRYRMLEGKSPESTAAHLVRFERQGLAQPYPPSRDAAAARRSPRRIEKFKTCPRGTRQEALMFPKELYTARSAASWARAHGFPVREIEESTNFIRIRVAPKKLFIKGSLRNVVMSERYGVRMIVGCPRFEVLTGGRTRRRVSESRRVAADY